MLKPLNWTDEADVTDVLMEALDKAEIDYRVSMETNSYGEKGEVSIFIDGRHFALSLSEVL